MHTVPRLVQGWLLQVHPFQRKGLPFCTAPMQQNQKSLLCATPSAGLSLAKRSYRSMHSYILAKAMVHSSGWNSFRRWGTTSPALLVRLVCCPHTLQARKMRRCSELPDIVAQAITRQPPAE